MTTIATAGGNTINIIKSGASYFYNINGVSSNPLSWPATVRNSNTSAGFVKVLFSSDMTFTSTDNYFICDSEKIQFGSESLNSDGSRRILTIGVDAYSGLVQNGTSGANGFNNIYIYNLIVDGSGYTTQAGTAWVGKNYFGKAGTGNFIINCTSLGSIASDGGGIIGNYSGTGSGSISILGCSSKGDVAVGAGGIAGANCENITCTQCFNEGSLGQNAGGIFGVNTSGTCSATKCYSIGAIGFAAGGIFGGSAKDGATATNCYSRGSIDQNAGGIFGNFAYTTTASNCYSLGTIGTGAGGIFGNPFGNTGIRTAVNCYSANGSWSSSTANLNLTGVPTGSSVGTIWVSTGTTQPYELNGFGYTPYSQLIIQSNSFVQSASQSFVAGQSSTAGIPTASNSYSILAITGGSSGSYAEITINTTTGAVSATTNVSAGIYTLTVRRSGSYFITTFVLTISAYVPPTPEAATSCCSSTIDERGIDYAQIIDYRIGNRLILEHQQNPNQKFDGYSQFVKYKMALGSRKV